VVHNSVLTRPGSLACTAAFCARYRNTIEFVFANRFTFIDGHNSLRIMVAPIAGTSWGMGTTIGAVLCIGGEESDPDLAVFMPSLK
jgi:hypothetical protein